MSKKIYISPSSQPDNTYAGQNTNEQEVCRAIARELKKALDRCGFHTICADYGTMYYRVAESNKWGASLHLPLHTNGFNGKVSGTRMMSYDLSGNGYKACKAIFNRLAPITPGTSENISANKGIYEIYAAYAPTAYIEVDFHDVPSVAKWLVGNKKKVAEAICQGVCDFYCVSYKAPEQDTPEQEKPATPAPTPSQPASINAGDLVQITGSTYYDGTTIPSWVKSQNWFVKSISGDRVVIDQNEAKTNNILSAVKSSNLKVVSSTQAEPEKKLEVGQAVRIKQGAPVYGTNSKFQSWVYDSQLYIRELRDNYAVVSIYKTGAITGSVALEYIVY